MAWPTRLGLRIGRIGRIGRSRNIPDVLRSEDVQLKVLYCSAGR